MNVVSFSLNVLKLYIILGKTPLALNRRSNHEVLAWFRRHVWTVLRFLFVVHFSCFIYFLPHFASLLHKIKTITVF